jgi:hypothetical protein
MTRKNVPHLVENGVVVGILSPVLQGVKDVSLVSIQYFSNYYGSYVSKFIDLFTTVKEVFDIFLLISTYSIGRDLQNL